MRKSIYSLTAALAAGMMLTACAPKTESGQETTAAVESSAVSEQPSEGGVTGETSQGDMLQKAHEAVKKAYGDNYIPNMTYDETALKEVFKVGPELYDAAIAEGPMISVNVETFIGIKAKEGKAKEVSDALEGYRKKQIEEAVQYPMNMVKLEAAQVITQGDYVFFLMLGTPDQAAEEQGEELALESAKKNNQIAVDAVNAVFLQ